jgi:hypothetical protein
MDPRLIDLLRRQEASGFVDLSGAVAGATIPISDRLINQVIAESLPRAGRIQQLRVKAVPGNQLAVRVTLSKPRFLPPLNLTVSIEQQPELPDSPIIGLRLSGGGGLMALAGPVATLFDALPPGVRMDKERVFVHLGTILAEHGLQSWLRYVEHLSVATGEGTVIISVAARVASA